MACSFTSHSKHRHAGTEIVLFELTGWDELIIVTNEHFCEICIQFVPLSFLFFSSHLRQQHKAIHHYNPFHA